MSCFYNLIDQSVYGVAIIRTNFILVNTAKKILQNFKVNIYLRNDCIPVFYDYFIETYFFRKRLHCKLV